MTLHLRRFYDFFIKLSDTQKIAIGFSASIIVAASCVALFCATTLASFSNHTPTHAPTSGELYSVELLSYEAAAYPSDAIAVIETPGEPTRYFLLRDYTEESSTLDTTTLHYTEAEQ